MEAANMAALLALPLEVLHNVLKTVDPQDLATLPRCCRALHTFISGNRQLFKELYLQRLASLTDQVLLS
jgi:F-box domain